MGKENLKQKILLATSSVVAAIGGFLSGYNASVISGAIIFIKEKNIISIIQEEVIIGIISIGAIFGSLIGGSFSDRFGRKKVVLFSSIIFAISAILSSLSHSVIELIIWRFVVGLGIGISSTIAPLYISEIAPKYMRGALVSINQLAITVGILFAYISGLMFVKTESWRLMFLIASIPAVIQLIVMSFLPESPRYLTKIGKKKDAVNILKRLRSSKKDAELELSRIETSIHQKKAKWGDLLSKKIRPALIAGITLTVIQQITGINTVIYYAPTIFKYAGFVSNKSALIATTLVGVVNVGMTFVAIFLLDRVGRKPLLYFGLSSMILSLLVLGVTLKSADTKIAGIICLITLFLYIGSFAYSLGPIGWLINSEIYPLHIRGRAMGVSTCINWLANFIITSTFLTIIHFIGKLGTFWIYGIIGIFGLYFIHKKIPETKGKSLETIEKFWEPK